MATKKIASSQDIYQIKVTLLDTKPPIWRRLLVPASMTLAKLHDVLQTAMGWHDCHMHEFRAGERHFGSPDPEDISMGMEVENERSIRLSSVLRRAGAKLIYTYDFGDNWEHAIVMEKQLPVDPIATYPVCTDGKLACPPDDCGGIPGFYELVDDLATRIDRYFSYRSSTELETHMIAAFVKGLFRRATESLPLLSEGFFSRPGKVCLETLLFLILPAFIVAQVTQKGVPPTADAQKCSALAQLMLEDAPGGPAIISSAQLVEVPATGLEQWIVIPSGYGSVAAHIPTSIHEYCDVTGYVAPQNKFELKLPLPGDWNKKFFFTACGGFCGFLDGRRCNLGLARGYATVTGNGGHESMMGFDGVWAANAPELQEDFGWRSNHVVTLIAKFIVKSYYGMPIKYSYMVGNSKGGQAVLMEAQRFPEDFDGLMPSAPVYDYTGRNTIAAAWFAQGISDGHGGSVITAEASQAVHKSVIEHCGAQAGIEEGLVTDPPSCKWQPEMIACATGKDSPDCLNEKQVGAIKRLMSPATNSKGEVLWSYPYIPGTETQWGAWNYFGALSAGLPPRTANLDLPGQHMRYLADEKVRENVDALNFDFDRDPPTLARSRRIYDATSFDLHAFKAHGGKILMWHGWADGAISATSSIGYYEGVTSLMGGRKQTEDFFRLFLIPGVHHGGGGPGLTEFDAFTALEDWVEKGQAPDKVIAGRSANGVVERSRPVFPYPILAHYSGHGDPKRADSFVPIDPSAR